MSVSCRGSIGAPTLGLKAVIELGITAQGGREMGRWVGGFKSYGSVQPAKTINFLPYDSSFLDDLLHTQKSLFFSLISCKCTA